MSKLTDDEFKKLLSMSNADPIVKNLLFYLRIETQRDYESLLSSLKLIPEGFLGAEPAFASRLEQNELYFEQTVQWFRDVLSGTIRLNGNI